MKKFKEFLLVDDSKGTNALNKMLLTEMELVDEVSTALNGQIALDYLTTKNEKGDFPNPEVIFLDINMPVMDGYQFLEAYAKTDISKKTNRVVIMLSTSIGEIDVKKAQEHEAVIGYQFKPLTQEKVNQIIGNIN